MKFERVLRRMPRCDLLRLSNAPISAPTVRAVILSSIAMGLAAAATPDIPVLPAASDLCTRWSPAKPMGQLDPRLVPEASGMVVSRTGNRLYFINDSGHEPALYSMNRASGALKKIIIKNFKAKDTEDLALGKCPSRVEKPKTASCLIVADIGDNLRRRSQIAFAFIEERETEGRESFSDRVEPLKVVSVRYPDGAHNAEAMGTLADGSIVIVTKETKGQSAQVYRAGLDKLLADRGKEPLLLEKIGSIDVAAILGRERGSLEVQVTGLSIAAGGARFVLLTYAAAIEFKLDLSRKSLPLATQLKEGEDYRILPITPLEQMEAIAYDKNDRDVLYTTERPPIFKRLFGVDGSVPIMAVTCERGKSK